MGVVKKYKAATKALQNYGYNAAKKVANSEPKNYYGAINPFPNPLKKSSYKR